MARIRIAAISDIHGNAPALRAVLADARRRGYDLLAQLGDAFSGPLWPSQTADLLRGIDAVHLRGNHDNALIDPTLEPSGDADRFASAELSSEVLDWVRSWPTALPIGGEALLFHGSPKSANYYLFDEAPHGDARLRPVADIERDLADVTARVCIGGHSHLPRLVEFSDGRLAVNAGSVGLPAFFDAEVPVGRRHENGSHHARYALVEIGRDTVSVSFVAVDYDWHAARDKAAREGFPEWAQWLSGRVG
jgi:predicted phosphodiesterase